MSNYVPVKDLKRINHICGDCGRVLFVHHEKCQYCGSRRLVTKFRVWVDRLRKMKPHDCENLDKDPIIKTIKLNYRQLHTSRISAPRIMGESSCDRCNMLIPRAIITRRGYKLCEDCLLDYLGYIRKVREKSCRVDRKAARCLYRGRYGGYGVSCPLILSEFCKKAVLIIRHKYKDAYVWDNRDRFFTERMITDPKAHYDSFVWDSGGWISSQEFWKLYGDNGNKVKKEEDKKPVTSCIDGPPHCRATITSDKIAQDLKEIETKEREDELNNPAPWGRMIDLRKLSVRSIFEPLILGEIYDGRNIEEIDYVKERIS